MLDIENIISKNVSYLHARDPSILAWNRHGLDEVRTNLAKQLNSESNEVTKNQDAPAHIQVFLRIKDGVPLHDLYEIDDEKLICKVPEGSYSLRNVKEGQSLTKTYSFTKIFLPKTTQVEIFNGLVKEKMLHFINGKNCSLLTYGASGSGKTFTIVGTPEEPGLIPRALEYIFRTIPKLNEKPKVIPLPNGTVQYLDKQLYDIENLQRSTILNATHVDRSVHIKTYKQMQQRLSSETGAQIDDLSNVNVSMWVSYAEIYNENIYDLLKTPAKGKQRQKLRLGNLKDHCYIKDLTSINVRSGIEAYQILQYGLHNLNYAATSVNSHSSRSHSIFTMKIIQSSEVEDGIHVNTFNFCDLAGSERVKKTLNVGDRLKESNNINTSLLVLGRCIHSVRSAQQLKDNRPIPFRESKLTQLFQRALTGLEDITMIVNMNPSKDMFDESQHVLNFSAIAKEILIEEQPKIVKTKRTSRFSRYMERKNNSIQQIEETVEEDERDIEINRLKEIITDLISEIQQQKLNFKEELKLEREHLISGYRGFMNDTKKQFEEQKAREIDELKKEHEQRIQYLNNYYSNMLNEQSSSSLDVISISSSDDDSDSEKKSPKKVVKGLETIISELNDKIKLLQQQLLESEIEKKMLQKETEVIPTLKEQINMLKKETTELEFTLDAAEKDFSELQSEVIDLKNENKKIMSEKLQLEEKVEQLEEFISHKNLSEDLQNGVHDDVSVLNEIQEPLLVFDY